MKAKELAEELLNYPDFDVELTILVVHDRINDVTVGLPRQERKNL